MGLVCRYIAKHYALSLLSMFFVVFALVLLTNLFSMQDDFTQLGMGQFMFHLSLRTVKGLKDYIPLTVIFGCALTVREFANNSEWAALMTLGYSRREAMKALMFVTSIYAFLAFIFIGYIAPLAEEARTNAVSGSAADIKNIFLHTKQGYWMHSPDFFMHVGDMNHSRLSEITVYYTDETLSLAKVIHSDRGYISDNHIILENPLETNLEEDRVSVSQFDGPSEPISLDLDMSVSFTNRFNVEAMNSSDIVRRFVMFQPEQPQLKLLYVAFMERIAVCIAMPIIALLIAASSFANPRAGRINQRITIAILLSVLCVLLIHVFISLGLVFHYPIIYVGSSTVAGIFMLMIVFATHRRCFGEGSTH